MSDADLNATASPEAVMCHCSGTTQGDIQCLFEQGFNLDAISRKTGALTGCGGCEWDIADFLGRLTQQKSGQ
ncbi:(2Fe-2S)-binding protein [Novimethylophilus kurashikiensis]|uniref:(2Fe-2S)-binding protein n=1 Tax=Novimethylophilus kurashikiensis TaxID=1825523 RepID=A0A2R5FGH1_9PROT|nr:(2Fe-2S)-binding protein [Novimethylophilus kurashikiensis]GBG15331.1 (2Fe-2S)-binding protein [Novimethylophilus kurashikiensis]